MDNFLTDELKEDLKPEQQWFKKKFRQFFPSKIRKLTLISLFALSGFVNLLGLIGIREGVINFNTHFFEQKFSNQSGIQQNGNNNSVVLSAATQCQSRYCSDFKDNNWIGIDKFIPVQPDPLILKSPNSAALPGANMFYKEEVGNFTARVFITPQATTSANLVLSYGHFYRCILGDSDYQQIACQINQSYPKIPEDWGYFDESGIIHGKNKQYQKRPFQAKNELDIRFNQRESDNNILISIKINDQVPAEWILPKKFQKQTLREKIGLGLITTTYDDEQAIFKHFELEPQI